MKFAYTLLLTLLVLSACTTTQDTTKIGAVLSLSGPAAAFGQTTANALELAAEEINANGGINGKHIELIIEDDATDGKKSAAAFTKLVTVDNVDAVIGGTFDFNYNAIAPLAEQYETVLITTQKSSHTRTCHE